MKLPLWSIVLFLGIFTLLGYASYIQCSDGECFVDAIKACNEGVSLYTSETGYLSSVRGIEDGRCVVDVTDGSSQMTCRFTDYTNILVDRQVIIDSCEGSLMDEIRSEIAENNTPTSGGNETILETSGPNGCMTHSECKTYCSAENMNNDPAIEAECTEYYRNSDSI